MTYKEDLKVVAEKTNNQIDRYLQIPDNKYFSLIFKAMRYSVLDAGKRIRAFMIYESGKIFNANKESLIRLGAVMEMVHCFSLIHDDLPAIDNDDLRRGKASSHKKWGEATAILAGDSLLNEAYTVLSSDNSITPDSQVRLELIKTLAINTGSVGMITGEQLDILAEDGRFKTKEEVDLIQKLKTGCLFSASVLFGAILGGATKEQKEKLSEFAFNFGLCFQITDDILDVEGDEKLVGKTLNKDDKSGKTTYISLFGLEKAKEYAKQYAENAISALSEFDEKADNLRDLTRYLLERKS